MFAEFAQLFEMGKPGKSKQPVQTNTARKTSLQISCNDPYQLLLSLLHQTNNPTKKSISQSQHLGLSFHSKKMDNEEIKQPKWLNYRKIKSGWITHMGIRNYQNMENQDVMMMDEIGESCKIYGLFDGHGQFGKQIAQIVKNNIQVLLQKYAKDIKNDHSFQSLEDILHKIIEKVNYYLAQHKTKESQYSGTTLLLIFITPFKITVFNIGNSRLILAKHYSQMDLIKPFQVTHDHTLARFDERLRIVEGGGEIKPYKNERGDEMGPERIWMPNKHYPGCVISRSLGLFCGKQIGVCAQAEVTTIDTDAAYHFMVLATDGLWSVLNNTQVISFIVERWGQDLTVIAQQLLLQAKQRWRAQGDLADDISIIIVSLI